MATSISLLDMRLIDIAKKIITANILFCIIVEFLIRDIGLPNEIRYISDFAVLVVLFCVLLDRKGIVKERKDTFSASAGVIVAAFVVWASISALFNFVPLALYVWALRNTVRFLLFFYLCALIYSFDDWKKLMTWLSLFVVVNSLFMVYQYFALGVRQDYLNGLLGTYVGGNSALNTVYIIVTAWLASNLISGKMNLKDVIAPYAAMLLASALNELKFYYVEFVAILLICALASPANRRNVLKSVGVVLGALFVFLVGTQLLFVFYPSFQNFFTIDSLEDYLFASSYNSNEQLLVNGVPVMNRLSSIGIIPEYFFDGVSDYLMGIGFGATETSSISFFSSSFFQIYGETNYLGYSSAYLLLELGFVGLFLYFCIFISVIRFCTKSNKRQRSGTADSVYSFAITLAILAFFICFYNSSLRIETSGYIFFAALAVPFMFNGERSLNDSPESISDSQKNRF